MIIDRMNFSMLRFVKQMAWMAALAVGCRSAFGFGSLGPPPAGPDAFEVPAIGYNLGGDIGTPKAVQQGYRRNTPVLYYAYDSSFLRFFGEQGTIAVDQALSIYNSVTNVDSYSQDLSEFPDDSRRQNFTAAAASLLDLRSFAMGLMTEQLGFFEPARWTWCLHGRAALPPGPCPLDVEYFVIQRNIGLVPSDLSGYQYSSYVNDVLYSYSIIEFCNGTPLAITENFPVDPLGGAAQEGPYSAVADFTSEYYAGLELGTFYTSLTRDDVGGLRYLIQTNNLAIEAAGTNTIEFLTNTQPATITNLDLNTFAAQALTNTTANLLGLYPGLIITSTNVSFPLAVTTNITETLTSSPYLPAGYAPTIPVFSTNFVTNVVQNFHYTFGNVVTNAFSTRGLAGSVSINQSIPPFSPAGTAPTVTTNAAISFVNGVFGTFFLLPTNFCSIQILSNLLTTVVATTNPPIVTSNAPAGGTNVTITFTPGSVTFATNSIFLYLPVTCPVDPVADYQGVERIQFERRDFDSLLNQFWQPITNDYVMVELTNSTLIPRHIQRTVLNPDFLYSAADLTANSSFTYRLNGNALTVTITGFGNTDAFRTIGFDQANRPPNQAGPGTINSGFPETLFVFNEVGPLFLNENPLLVAGAPFLGQPSQVAQETWGSFDGTTNPPIVYPNGTSYAQLIALTTGPFITTASLPAASLNQAYSAELTATGGQPPYTWSLSPNSGLPSGLTLTTDQTTNPNGNGLISGTPTGPGGGQLYDVSVRVTDSAGAFKDVAFTITVF